MTRGAEAWLKALEHSAPRQKDGGKKIRNGNSRTVCPRVTVQAWWLAAAVPMKSAVKVRAVCHSISVVPVWSMLPVSWRPPMPTGPYPMVITPSPTTADPDVSRCRTDRHGFHNLRRHWRGLADWSWSHDNRGWNRNGDSEVDSEMNSGVYSCDSRSRQNQNCNCLFHNIYLTIKLDAVAVRNIVTRELPFCKASGRERVRFGRGSRERTRSSGAAAERA